MMVRVDKGVAQRSDLVLIAVEVEHGLGNALSRWLRQRGAEPRLARSLAQARALVETEPIDVALVDLELPDGDAVELVSELATHTSVIAISAYLDAERMAALQLLGAAMLAKPWTEPALVALLDRALEKRRQDPLRSQAPPPRASTEGFGPESKIRIERAGRAVASDGKRVALTPMQLAVLELLQQRTDQPVSSQDLALALGYAPRRLGVDAAVRRHVYELRRRLRAIDLTLRNSRGFGYYLAAVEGLRVEPKFSHNSHTSRARLSAKLKASASGSGTNVGKQLKSEGPANERSTGFA